MYVFSLIVQHYIIQGQGFSTYYYDCQHYMTRDIVRQFQGIDGYFCDNVLLLFFMYIFSVILVFVMENVFLSNKFIIYFFI